MVNRYPPHQLRQMADDLAHDLGGDGMYSQALRQASDDAEFRQFWESSGEEPTPAPRKPE
jgi:hypothetical protein